MKTKRIKDLELVVEKITNEIEVEMMKEQPNYERVEVLISYKVACIEELNNIMSNISDTCLRIVAIGAPLIVYGMLFKAGLKFEENGVYSSTTVRNLMGSFKIPFFK